MLILDDRIRGRRRCRRTPNVVHGSLEYNKICHNLYVTEISSYSLHSRQCIHLILPFVVSVIYYYSLVLSELDHLFVDFLLLCVGERVWLDGCVVYRIRDKKTDGKGVSRMVPPVVLST